jgi:hypothetical protein
MNERMRVCFFFLFCFAVIGIWFDCARFLMKQQGAGAQAAPGEGRRGSEEDHPGGSVVPDSCFGHGERTV